MKILLTIAATASLFLTSLAGAQAKGKPDYIHITNVTIFDGLNEQTVEGSVLIENNLIKEVGADVNAPEGASVIEGDGKFLMPGLIDCHVHLYLTGVFQTFAGMQAAKWDEVGIMVSENARDYLYDGYTTVRDTGGMSDGLRKLVDKGATEGPRVYACGAVISPTSGHGDWRIPTQVYPSADPDLGEKLGFTYLADSPDEIRKASRHCFAHGASFLKLMAGGGVSSELDPLWSIAYSITEMKAAVEAARFFDTYVTTHAYTDETVNMAIDAGVKCIEHGQMVSEKTVKRIAENGIFWSLNVAGMDPALLQHPNFAMPTVKPKLESFLEGSQSLAAYVKKYKPKIVHNVDTVLSTVEFGRKHRDFEKFYFAQMFGNFEMLKSATSTAGELAQLTNKRNPYPHKLGVIEPGAYADILIVDGNPLKDLSCLGANPKWFDAEPRDRGFDTINLIMKDGNIYKNTLTATK
jgi:imidazolonepropionase-like amidohydrolase